MSVRPSTPLPTVPDTTVLRNRPSASSINNPISLTDPVLPAVPAAASGFVAAPVPAELPVDLEAFRQKLQATSELALAKDLDNNGSKGLYFRSSATQQAAASSASNYLAEMGKEITAFNDVVRSSDLLNARYLTMDYAVAVKKYVAQVSGAVDRFEASADAYVQAQNIIYDADVTAIKLKDSGIEKAVGIESDYIADIRKTESQVFLNEVNRNEAISSREVQKRSQIRIDESKQLGIQGYTAYEHARSNEARAYEVGTISQAEYEAASNLAQARINVARSAAEVRRVGAISVSDARIAATTDTTTEKGIQQLAGYAADVTAVTQESAAQIQVLEMKQAARLDADLKMSLGQIQKMRAISEASIANKGREFTASNEVLIDKTAAKIDISNLSLARRVSLNGERIAVTSQGYIDVNAARMASERSGLDAQLAAMPIVATGMASVVGQTTKDLTTALESKLEYVKEVNENIYNAEKDNAADELAATIASIKTTGAAEAKAATDRANASIEASQNRNEAILKSALDINEASLDLVRSKAVLLNQRTVEKYGVDEALQIMSDESDLNNIEVLNSVTLAADEITAGFDLDTIKGLNQARLESQGATIEATVKAREAEIEALLAADNVKQLAQAYAQERSLAAHAYTTSVSSEAGRIERAEGLKTSIITRAASLRESSLSRQWAAKASMLVASETMVTRRDVFAYHGKARG